jgi:hypothetical protein
LKGEVNWFDTFLHTLDSKHQEIYTSTPEGTAEGDDIWEHISRIPTKWYYSVRSQRSSKISEIPPKLQLKNPDDSIKNLM